MADQNLRIVVAAETAAAQKAIADLSAEELGLAKASDRAGDAVKRTAQEVAEATAKQNAAREAVQRAAKALAEHTAITQSFGKDSAEAAASLARLKAAEDAAAVATRAAEQALEGAAQAVAETAKNADEKALPALRRLKAQLEGAGKSAESTASDLRTLEARIEGVGGAAKGMGAAMSSFVGNLAANAVSSLTSRLADVAVHAVSTAASFETMKISLTTTLGSTEAANKAFADLQRFAAETPFDVAGLTDSFIKLSNRGLDPSNRALRAYGDTASAMGKGLSDMIEAVADASVGEFERLKEFGVKASSQGDKVTFVFRGVSTTVAKESKAIEEYLIKLGETNFAGGMEAQAKSLAGMLSTLKDGFDQFLVGVLDSGVVQALKSIMGSFSGMGETGKLLGDILGFTLGGAFTGLAATVKVATTAIELFATGLNYVLEPARMLRDTAKSLADEAFAAVAVEAEKATAAQRELDAAYWEGAKGSGTLATDMQRLIDLSGQYATAIIGEGLAHIEAANAADRRMKAEADLWAKLEERQRKAEDKAIEDAFMAANEMGPALPPGFKRDKGKGKKKKKDGVSMSDSLGAASRYEKRERAEREGAFAAEVEGYEAESAAREKRIDGLGREIELLEARGIAETESVDLIFRTVEVESEAARRREQLIDQRLAAEERLARWQLRNAKTTEQRERAMTRLEEVEAAKRIRAAKKVADEEAKTARDREKVFSTLASAHNALAETMIDAAFAAAEGEKVAIAAMLKELLAGVAQKHTLLSLAEAASAVAAAASYRYAAAAQHGVAAGLHAGVAILAGGGAVAAGQVASQRAAAEGGGSSGREGSDRGGRAGGGSGDGPVFGQYDTEDKDVLDTRSMSGEKRSRIERRRERQEERARRRAERRARRDPYATGPGGAADAEELDSSVSDEDGDLEQQDTPVSHEQLRRASSSARRGGGAQVVISGTVNLYGAGGRAEFIEAIRRDMAKQDRGGARPWR